MDLKLVSTAELFAIEGGGLLGTIVHVVEQVVREALVQLPPQT